VDVRLKLFATYRRYMPPESQGSVCDLQVPAGTQVADVLAEFGIPADGSVILVNGHGATPERSLKGGDVVAVFPSMAGG